MPISATTCGTNADSFGVSSGVACLDAKIVAFRNDVVVGIDEDGAYGEAPFGEA